MKASEINLQYLDDIKSAVLARIRFNVQHLSSAKRFQNYLLGLPANDCEEIKKNEDLLFKWYEESSGIFAQDFDNGLNSFINILNFVSTLSICKKWQIKRRAKNDGQMSFDFKIPDKKAVAQSNLFCEWISGKGLKSLENSLKEFLPKIDVDDYREGMFENNLSWGISAISRYLNSAAEQKGIPLTKDLDYLSAFVKYGVNSKIACQLVRLRIPRTDAVKISRAFKEKFQSIEVDDEETPSLESDFIEAINALNLLTEKELHRLNIGKSTMERIKEIRERYKKETTDIEPEFPPFEYSEPSD